MKIASSTFTEGEPIPRRHSREGDELSPPLSLDEIPDGTGTLALVVDDPDAPGKTWVHWLLWDLPPHITALPEGVPRGPEPSGLGGARQGINDFGEVGYGGPMPPRSHGRHRYYFTVFAVDGSLELEAGADRQALEEAMSGRVLDRARCMGTYER